MTNKMSSNEGSLGLLMNDKTLYINLSNTAGAADKLLIDVKENPKRYVNFSKAVSSQRKGARPKKETI